jgi:3-oxoadipate enol-lactonase
MTVVLCGSLGSTAAMWDSQAAVTPSASRFELPGHGAAPVVEVRGVRDLADRLLAGVDGAVSLVGVSFGASVCAAAAATAPDRVDRLVLACTSSRFGEPAQWHERARIVRSDGLEAIVDAVMARWFTPSFEQVARYRAMFLSVDPEGYARCCEAIAEWDGAEVLGAIRAPTLVIAGSADPTSPPEHAEELSRWIAGSRVALLDGAQHLANVEFAEEFNALLEGFL